jgi:hypothetical protein
MYKFILTETDREVMHNIDSVQCTDIISEFVYFLKGASFHESTIVTALQHVLEEYEVESKEDI